MFRACRRALPAILIAMATAVQAQQPPTVFRRNLERVASLDPAQAEAVPASRAVALMYETLLEYDYTARPYRLIPGLARALPEVSSNGQVFVFHLDPDARFSADPCFGMDAAGRSRDRAVTAQDVAYALKRLADRKQASPGAWLVEENICGMHAFAERSASRTPTDYDRPVDGLQTPDAVTLRIALTRPFPPFLWLTALSYAAAVPREAVERYGAAFGEHPVGSGPYALVSWRRNYEMIFARNRGWRGWQRGPAAVTPGAPPPFERLVYLVIDDPITQWLAFLAGELDLHGEISRENWDAVVGADGQLRPELARQGIRLARLSALDIAYIGFNMEDPVLGPNRKLRQALNCAFDSARWEVFMNRRVTRADGPVPPGVAGRLAEPFAYGFDLSHARALLAEAGYPGGRDPATGRRLQLSIDLGRTTQDVRESTELLAAFFERVGIDLQPHYHTWTAFLQKIANRQTQLFRLEWVGDYPDAENFLQLFYGRNVSPGPNRCNYVNPAFDRLYEEACSTPDEATRLKLYEEMQRIVREDCPWLFMHVPVSCSPYHATTLNFHPHDFPYGMEKYLRAGTASGTP